MKIILPVILLIFLAQDATGHYIFNTLITASKSSTSAVRQPAENSPVHNYTGAENTCNVNTSPASETVSVKAGSKIGFKLGEGKAIYHPGPVAMYLGKAPAKVRDWDGSGKRWFKIAEWGAKFDPFGFITMNKTQFTTTIPKSVPSGEYLVGIEQIALHIPGTPEFFISCAQIKVTGGGKGTPKKVAIPGYVSREKDPGLTVDIYWPIPTSYKVPGPAVYKGS